MILMHEACWLMPLSEKKVSLIKGLSIMESPANRVLTRQKSRSADFYRLLYFWYLMVASLNWFASSIRQLLTLVPKIIVFAHALRAQFYESF